MSLRKLDVLASLFAVFVKVAVQVRTVLPAALTPLAALRVATANILPAVCPRMSGVEEVDLWDRAVPAAAPYRGACPPVLPLCVAVSAQALPFGPFSVGFW